MKLSKKARTRLVVLNACMWLVTGVTVLALLGGPRGAFENWVEPIETELGGWFDLALGAAGWNESPLPHYELIIEPDVFRAAALLGRDRAPDDRWWFPARFYAEGVAYPVDLQFVGTSDSPSRVLDQSWRVRFQGKDSYHGIRELELSPAEEQTHAIELMVRERAGNSGLLAPPGGFATLAINGAEAGNFFWSEGNSRAMLDRLGYPKGEILTPSSNATSIPARLAGAAGEFAGFAHYVPAIDRDGTWSVAERKLERLMALAENASDAEFESQIPELLEVEKFLRWNALLWVFADPADHGLPELSWYFDPVTGLFEPIVRELGQTPAAVPVSHAARLTSRLLESPVHRARRNELLWELVGQRGDEIVTAADALLGSVLNRLAKAPGALGRPATLREIAEFRRSTRADLRRKVKSLETALAASQVETTPVLSLEAGMPTLTLTLEPSGLAEIQLDEIRFELGAAALAGRQAADLRVLDPDGGERHRESVAPLVIGSSVVLHPAMVAMEPSTGAGSAPADRRWTVEFRLPFFSPEAWARPDSVQSIDVVYRNAVTGESLPPAHLLTPEMLARTPGGDYRALFRPIDELVAASQLPLEVVGRDLVLPAGEHRLMQTLVIPRAYRLRLEPGVTLWLGPDVSVISFRGITAEGSAQQPIHIRAADPARPWGSVAVARAPEVSKLSFVTVSGGSRATFQGIEFDGQLSFNASDLLLGDSEIYDSHASDGLSVKRANFEVIRSQFVANRSDGMESEWSHGTVRESLFINNGDDGLDLADSEVTVEDCAFHWMGDKSISAGERSRVTVTATRLSDSEVAIASKEDSRVDVRDTEFRRNRLGFSLYRSKPVFGGGSGSVTGGVFARNEQDFSVEPGSNLELNDVQREAAPTEDDQIGALALRPVVTRSR